MNQRLLTLALLLTSIIVTGACAQLPTTPNPTVSEKSLEPREAKAYQYDKATPASNAAFVFTADDHLVFDEVSHEVRLRGWLSNSSHQTQTVYLATKTPFVLDLKPSPSVSAKPIESKTPSLFVLEIPAMTKVPFIAAKPETDLSYVGSPTATFRWTFKFWSEPRLHGELSTTLPARQEASLKLTLERFDHPSTHAAKLIATLTNVSQAPQSVCHPTVIWLNADADTDANTDAQGTTNAKPAPPAPASPPKPSGSDSKLPCRELQPQEAFELESATLQNGSLTTRASKLKNIKSVKARVEYQTNDSTSKMLEETSKLD